MKFGRLHSELIVAVFFVFLIGVVFQQIATSMTEQGIAGGSPVDDAAAYPRFVALFIGAVLLALLMSRFVLRRTDTGEEEADQSRTPGEMVRPISMLVIFGVYVLVLRPVGYYVATVPMLSAVMMVAGERKYLKIFVISVATTVLLGFIFEAQLNIVLPSGYFQLNL